MSWVYCSSVSPCNFVLCVCSCTYVFMGANCLSLLTHVCYSLYNCIYVPYTFSFISAGSLQSDREAPKTISSSVKLCFTPWLTKSVQERFLYTELMVVRRYPNAHAWVMGVDVSRLKISTVQSSYLFTG